MHLNPSRRRFLKGAAMGAVAAIVGYIGVITAFQPLPTSEVKTALKPAGEKVNPSRILQVELRDVRSGESFRLADFKGKIVVLELFAVWCPLCTRQQVEMLKAKSSGKLSGDVIFVSLDIDPNEDEEKIRDYLEFRRREGLNFDWLFAVDPQLAIVKELEKSYGSTILDVTQTFLVLIDPDQTRMLRSRAGVKSANELSRLIARFLEGEV